MAQGDLKHCGVTLSTATGCEGACAVTQFKGQTVLIGVDDMDLFKGIELKLLALERVLDYHPEWRGRLALIQVTNAPR